MKDCFWLVFNKREGVLKSSSSRSAAAKWRQKNRPHGTRLVHVSIPPR